MDHLGDLIDRSALTCTGKTVGENLAEYAYLYPENPEIVRTRQDPFAPPFRPHFNALKFCALVGIHAMYACRFHPEKLRRLSPGFADFAGRIYGYVDKAHISKQDVRAMEEKIRRFV